MTEEEFWGKLEWRICVELGEMPNVTLRHLWCDGILGETISTQNGRTHIVGVAWILGGRGEGKMRFTMALPDGVSVASDVPWEALFPPDDVTNWLCVDLHRREVTIDLSKAEPIERT